MTKTLRMLTLHIFVASLATFLNAGSQEHNFKPKQNETVYDKQGRIVGYKKTNIINGTLVESRVTILDFDRLGNIKIFEQSTPIHSPDGQKSAQLTKFGKFKFDGQNRLIRFFSDIAANYPENAGEIKLVGSIEYYKNSENSLSQNNSLVSGYIENVMDKSRPEEILYKNVSQIKYDKAGRVKESQITYAKSDRLISALAYFENSLDGGKQGAKVGIWGGARAFCKTVTKYMHKKGATIGKRISAIAQRLKGNCCESITQK